MKNKHIMIAGGGTGGHIYPGIAIAKAIQELDPSVDVVFLGTKEGSESKIVPKEGFPLKLIEVGKLNYAGDFFLKLKTLLKLPLAFWQSFKILRQYEPKAVLGVGGYASGPFVLMAAFMGFKTALWEANAHPGLANRFLSRFVRKAFLVFEEAKSLLFCRQMDVFGLPVRLEIEKPLPVVASEDFRILVFGGSQGARAINKALSQALIQGGAWLQGLKVVHQTGTLDFLEIKKLYEEHGASLRGVVAAHEFLYDMNVQYAHCDLVICRGGASTVAELAASGKVAIVIPLPTAADNHQEKNAQMLVKNQAGTLLLQKNLTPEALINEIQNLRQNDQLRKKISENIQKLFVPQAAKKIARDLLEGL